MQRTHARVNTCYLLSLLTPSEVSIASSGPWSSQVTTEIPLLLVCKAPLCPKSLCAVCMPLLFIFSVLGSHRGRENFLRQFVALLPENTGYPTFPRVLPLMGSFQHWDKLGIISFSFSSSPDPFLLQAQTMFQWPVPKLSPATSIFHSSLSTVNLSLVQE